MVDQNVKTNTCLLILG